MSSPTITSAWQAKRAFEETNRHMLQNGILCDVTFLAGSSKKEEMKAHKFILASRSPVFYAMFCGSLAESSNAIQIPDIEPVIFRELLRFIYTEDCTVNEDNVMPLLYSAKKYETNRLTEKCKAYLNTQLSIDNVCVILQHVHKFDEGELEEKCLKFVLENGDDVIKSDGFSSLSKAVLQKIIQSDKLKAGELNIYDACKRWALQQCEKKGDKREILPADLRAKLGDLIYLIRFPTMSNDVFSKHVSRDHILTAEKNVSVFQSIAEGSSDNVKNFFCSAKRNVWIPNDRITIKRCDLNTTLSWGQLGPPDAINFRVSHQARLLGVSLFSPRAAGTLVGKLRLQCCNSILSSKSDIKITFQESKYCREFLFDNPQIVEPDKEYSIYAELKGSNTYRGLNGLAKASSGSFCVSFFSSEKSTNGTSVAEGQFRYLIFDV
ncbi:BTB/POZ domain-containing protein 6-like isoform X1 [Mercenaria mercenaria]|uniref:BTB/POZ domain-containing protein 6-like isoform X1 n=1 Tax=Mercenaria mercenaria TaxID=6596 RepID=UPI00234F2F49|nr:BTB/POZ domain-containing protein 6-like isoform X1 [Mercenaria mercenaria]XP_053373268.1 BTB/POZ domain-containing protein 6-like isoform X1 [Mercenaria mercenaria]